MNRSLVAVARKDPLPSRPQPTSRARRRHEGKSLLVVFDEVAPAFRQIFPLSCHADALRALSEQRRSLGIEAKRAEEVVYAIPRELAANR